MVKISVCSPAMASQVEVSDSCPAFRDQKLSQDFWRPIWRRRHQEKNESGDGEIQKKVRAKIAISKFSRLKLKLQNSCDQGGNGATNENFSRISLLNGDSATFATKVETSRVRKRGATQNWRGSTACIQI